MTTAEALLAMKIGCKVIPANWKDLDTYYEIQGNSVYYVHKTLGFAGLVCAVDKFIEKHRDMVWSLHDNTAGSTSDEGWMQDQN